VRQCTFTAYLPICLFLYFLFILALGIFQVGSLFARVWPGTMVFPTSAGGIGTQHGTRLVEQFSPSAFHC
jgi:hypothetical protein